MLKVFYRKVGGDYRDVHYRLEDDETILHFLENFLREDSYRNFLMKYEAHEKKEAYRYIHTLKGVSLNLGFGDLFRISEEIANEFRSGCPELTVDQFVVLERRYNTVIEGIREVLQKVIDNKNNTVYNQFQQ